LKIQKVDKITDLKYLNMFKIAYLDKTGQEKSWELATRSKEPKCASGQFSDPDAVVIVPFHQDEKKLVVIKEFRVSLGGYQYGFPAGLVDDGETVMDASTRELFEETGLNLTSFIRISPAVYSSSGMTDESVCMVYAKCTGEPSSAGNTTSEDIETFFVSPSEALQLCEDVNNKLDVKTWLVLISFAMTNSLF